MLKGFLANIKLITRITIFVSAYEKNCNKTFVDEKKIAKKCGYVLFMYARHEHYLTGESPE